VFHFPPQIALTDNRAVAFAKLHDGHRARISPFESFELPKPPWNEMYAFGGGLCRRRHCRR